LTGLKNTEMEQELRGINGEMTDEEDEAKKKDNNDDDNCEIGFGGIQLESFETKEPLRYLMDNYMIKSARYYS